MLTGQALVDAAAAFAKAKHGGQTRKDRWKTPYYRHPEAVAGRFANHWAFNPDWRIHTEGPFKVDYCTGLALCHLHDVKEDCGVTVTDLRAAGFSDDLDNILDVLTHGRDQSYLAYLLAIREYRDISVLPWLVKLCDIEDNTSSLGNLTDRRRAKWLATKYEMAEYILRL